MHRRLLLALPLALAALLGAGAGPAAAAPCAGADARPSGANTALVRAATLCLLNQQRAQAGLGALATDGLLETAATRYTARMLAEGFFAHVAPDGTDIIDRLTAVGYLRHLQQYSVGENLGTGSGGYVTPAAMVQAWMLSPGHRANILERSYTAIGIGVAIGSPSIDDPAAVTYTTDFGSTVHRAAPAPAATKPTAAPPKHRRHRARKHPRRGRAHKHHARRQQAQHRA